MAKNDLGHMLSRADRNFDRNMERFGPARIVGEAVATPVMWVAGRGNSFLEKVGRMSVAGLTIAALVVGGREGYKYLNEEACDSAYFDDLGSAASGEPCSVPVVASLELLSADEQHAVPDIIALELDTDTKALGEQGKSYRVLEVAVTGQSTANYAQTALAADLPADQVNSLALFGIYNNAINAGGEMGQRAEQLCAATVEDMLASVRSNPEWFANDSFPASMVVDPNLVPHASEGGVGNFEIKFVTYDEPPQLTPTATTFVNQDVKKRSLACAEGPGA